MKQRFQILNDPRFHLVYGVTQRFSYGPSPKLVRLNREGFTLVPGLKRKTPVYPGMLLGEHPAPDKGDLFASIHGEISEITERSVFLAATDPSKDAPEVEPVDLLGQGLEGDELALAVKKMGVNTRSLGRRCKTLIINALNPDPGVTWAEPMLVSHVENLRTGMELHRRMARADNVILAVPKGSKVAYEGIPLAYVEPEYPNSVDQLVIKAVNGEENPGGVGIVGLHNIWSLGRVGRLGRPLIETVVTIGSYEHSGNYIVRDGSTIGELLQFANIRLKDGDTDRLDRSVTKGTYGIFVVEAGTIPPMEGHSPCVSCGACVLVCPARLKPSNLSRYAEFALHERCRAEHIESCLECGLCGYVCIARRPVLQYIRLAKRKLAEMERDKGLVELKTKQL